MSGIYGTRDRPPKISSRSKSSPDGQVLSSTIVLANGNSTTKLLSTPKEQKSSINPRMTSETPKIQYNSGVVIERSRTRSGDSQHSDEVDPKVDEWKRKVLGTDSNCQASPCNSANSTTTGGECEFVTEKEVLDRNYNLLMQQLAAVLVEKETLVYQVHLLGQAYGELRTELTAMAERENVDPPRLECLRDERHRLADYVIGLTAADSKEKCSITGISSPPASTTSNISVLRTQKELWRNKFMASTLIVDELSNQRLFLLRQFEDAQQVVIGLLEEKETTRKRLFDTFLYLQETKETLDPLDRGKYRHLTNAHTLENLVESNEDLARALHRRLLNTTRKPGGGLRFTTKEAGSGEENNGAINGASGGDEETETVVVVPSEMEKQAKKVMEIDVKALESANPCEDFQRLINERAHAAGLPPPNMHNIVVNCCRRCEGQIKIV